MFKEFKHLNDGAMPVKSVFGAIKSDNLIPSKSWGALETVNLIKQKRIRNIKGITCADGGNKYV